MCIYVGVLVRIREGVLVRIPLYNGVLVLPPDGYKTHESRGNYHPTGIYAYTMASLY